MASLKVACVVTLVCMALVGAPMVQAITCGQVVSALSPCIPYLRMGGAPSAGCCNGVRTLNKAAATTADRKTACVCLKNAAGNIGGISPTYSQSLPGKCGVNLPYKFSTSTNCNTIN
ncbi:non-specific lipid-transfer protein 1-like [Arachis stenosperma]|uniref:non-specific lipid-transfer protein 1-like n=1 Tax=Arachis stenosperma TaxID=217475 RepID=UPI0025AD78F1|nr:non-specific lipid-transfer protein 1-like [Arachis stenosperma]